MMVDGPKNDGTSLDVVTGVFRSPVCDSAVAWTDSPTADDSLEAPPFEAPLVLSRLKCGCTEEAVAEVTELAEDVAIVATLPPCGECCCDWCCCR